MKQGGRGVKGRGDEGGGRGEAVTEVIVILVVYSPLITSLIALCSPLVKKMV